MFDIKNKKITIMGLGLLGRGVNDAIFLAKQGAKLTVTDLKPKERLKESLAALKGLKIEFVLGNHRRKDFINKDYILKAAGVPLNSPYIKIAKKNKIPVKMDDSWFAEYFPGKIIGITGTRGKTTTTYLISELLKLTKQKIYLSGNIVGKATLPLIKKAKKDDLVVLELSSWQLQGWADAKKSPQIAVITNIYNDHLNYYGSMSKYINDKKAIFRNQTDQDYLILNKDNKFCREFAKEAKSKLVWFTKNDVPKDWRPLILGEHNLANIAAAIAVAKIFKIKMSDMKMVVEDFKGVPGRQELVRDYKGIKYYNDTTATTPDAAIAALKSFKQKVVLLAGGTDKKLEFKELAKVIKDNARALILLEGSATEKLVKELRKINFNKTKVFADSMAEAFKQAKYILKKGDVFLFSPGAASFGMFRNEFDRGEQFIKQVKKIK